jgi:hypothetical protein
MMMALTFVLSVLLMSISLGWGFALAGWWGWTRWVAAVGLLWLWAERRRAVGYSSLAFLFAVGAAAYGIWRGLPISVMFLGALGALLAWDLSLFRGRLRRADPGEDLRSAQRHHLERVFVVGGAGLLGAGILALRPMHWAFETALAFVLFSLVIAFRLVIPWLIRFFQQEE